MYNNKTIKEKILNNIIKEIYIKNIRYCGDITDNIDGIIGFQSVIILQKKRDQSMTGFFHKITKNNR